MIKYCQYNLVLLSEELFIIAVWFLFSIDDKNINLLISGKINISSMIFLQKRGKIINMINKIIDVSDLVPV